jgi:hypothetical protein
MRGSSSYNLWLTNDVRGWACLDLFAGSTEVTENCTISALYIVGGSVYQTIVIINRKCMSYVTCDR